MNIIDHLSLGVTNIDQASKFYDNVFATLGVENMAKTPQFVAYGHQQVQFLLMLPRNQEPATSGNGTHISFVAPSQEAVQAFYDSAINNGGQCAGSPGPREDYPLPNVFTAFVVDPFGNKLEVIHNGFAA